MMKRFISFILVSVFLFMVLTACGGGAEVSLMPFLGVDDGSLDLDGREVVFLGETETDSGMFIDGQIIVDTLLYDSVIERFGEINKRYNVKIVYQGFSTSDAYEDRFNASMASGVCPADIIYGHGNTKLQVFAESGYLYPLTEVKDFIDYENSAKFGTAGILEGAMVNGVPYAVQPVNWPGFQNNFSYFIVYNPDLVTLQGYTDLHEYYENGTWTWDVYESMIADFDNGGNENMYALSSMERDFADLALRSNGVKYVVDENGIFKSDITSQKAVDALQWMQDIFKNYTENIRILDTWELSDFVDGRVMTAITVGAHLTAGELQYDSNIEFSIMPFPCGPQGTYGEWAQSAAAIRGLAIPSSNESPDVSARIINDLCDPFEAFGGDAGLSNYFNEEVFFDPIDTEIFLTIGNYIRYAYGRSDPGILTLLYAIESSYKSSSAVEILESVEPKLATFIEETVKPNYVNYIHDHLYAE